MRSIIAGVIAIVAGCGYSSQSNQMIGQVKKVIDNTPIVCSDYTSADVSLGVLRNGVGSMSTQDVEVFVPNKEDVDVLRHAADTGDLVRITYDVERVVFCVPDHQVTRVEVIPSAPAK